MTILDEHAEVADAARVVPTSRLKHIDALRVFGCLSVVAVHAFGGPFPVDSVGSEATTFLLHYSREIFLFVSALVLVRAYASRALPDGRLPNPRAFRRRRLRLIGTPYLVWTGLYGALAVMHAVYSAGRPLEPELLRAPGRWLYQLASGSGWYHLYFLLVTLQFALVFPLVLRLLLRARGHHWRLLGVSLVLQLATLAIYHDVGRPGGLWRGLIGDASLIAYQFWLLAGAIAGLSLQRWHAWILANRRWIVAAFPLAAAGLLGIYYAHLPYRGPLRSSDPLQPAMLIWSIVALGAFYLAAIWVSQRRSRLVHAAVGCLARLSFGIYLAHPLILDVVLALFGRLGLLSPRPWVAGLTFLVTLAATLVSCLAIERTRLSQALLGRPFRQASRRLDQTRRHEPSEA